MCNRGNCRSVLCDRFSGIHGYLCDSCFQELVRLGANADVYAFMRSDIPDDYADISLIKWGRVFPEAK